MADDFLYFYKKSNILKRKNNELCENAFVIRYNTSTCEG